MNKLMSIFDTHCHLADQRYQEQNKSTQEIIQEAEKVGVKYILNTGQDMPTNRLLLKQLKKFPNLFGALGLHPNSKEDLKEENLTWIEQQLTDKKIIAIGEIGLDYYWEKNISFQKTQKYWLKKQLELAKKYNLPVLLHIRNEEVENEFSNAFTDTYKIVKEVGNDKGILHCFTGDWEIAQKFINLGFYISFAGNITRSSAKWKAKWKTVIEKIPLHKIVVETDAPYLVPEPLLKKEKFNYPQNIIYTLRKIAEIKKIELEKLTEQIFRNTLEVFGLES